MLTITKENGVYVLRDRCAEPVICDCNEVNVLCEIHKDGVMDEGYIVFSNQDRSSVIEAALEYMGHELVEYGITHIDE